MKLNITDWNIIPYAEAWTRQTECFDALIRAKQVGQEYENHIILCEHPHVYTLGRSGKEGNMLLGEDQLQRIGATLYHIDCNPCMCLLWYRCRSPGESNRCLVGR